MRTFGRRRRADQLRSAAAAYAKSRRRGGGGARPHYFCDLTDKTDIVVSRQLLSATKLVECERLSVDTTADNARCLSAILAIDILYSFSSI